MGGWVDGLVYVCLTCAGVCIPLLGCNTTEKKHEGRNLTYIDYRGLSFDLYLEVIPPYINDQIF